MKQLKTLIKYHRNLLDQKRRALKLIQDEEDEIINMSAFLEKQLEEEQKLYQDRVDMGINFGTYQQSVYDRQDALELKLEEVRQRLDKAQEEVRECWREVKKYELTLERRQEEARKELERKNQSEADENTASRWIRKES